MKHTLERVELILVNGKIYTQDPSQPLAEALAIGCGRILKVGSSENVRVLAGPGTETVDLAGRPALPGFMDSHFHYKDWALGRLQLMLAEVRSLDELLASVAAAARSAAPRQWLLGQGWNEAEWPQNRMPTKEDLDAAAPANPTALWRCDLHLAVVNSRALELAGIREDTPNPPGGSIGRDASGMLNGILKESAINLIRPVIAPPDAAALLSAMREGIGVLHSLGITGLHDVRLMGELDGARTLSCWQQLHEGGELALRCWVSLPGECVDHAVSLGLRTGFGDSRLRLGHLKLFADGGMGARTAWMIDPYLDADCGMPLLTPQEISDLVHKADRAGLAVMIHAIGDRANRQVVSLFEALQEARDRDPKSRLMGPSIPHRMEHVQMIRPEDLTRLGQLNVVASVQPNNMVIDMSMIDQSVGPKGKWTYPFRALLDAGVPVLFSSDCPVCNPSPLLGIHAAVTRRRKDGTPEGGWHPEQRITVAEAVRAFTLTPAFSYGQQDRLGSITEGKYADMVVLDQDIYAVDPMEIAWTNVDLTIFDGRIVHRRAQ